jgi:hypothetical protein
MLQQSPATLKRRIELLQKMNRQLRDEVSSIRSQVRESCLMLTKISNSCPKEFGPSLRGVHLFMSGILKDKAFLDRSMTKGEQITAKKRLLADEFLPRLPPPHVMRDDGIPVEHVALLISLLYAYSYPSSLNQTKQGLRFFSFHSDFYVFSKSY